MNLQSYQKVLYKIFLHLFQFFFHSLISCESSFVYFLEMSLLLLPIVKGEKDFFYAPMTFVNHAGSCFPIILFGIQVSPLIMFGRLGLWLGNGIKASF